MAFKFTTFCDLLEELEKNRLQKALPSAKLANPDLRTITTWFNQHNSKISRTGPSAIAFLSCLFPERRVDRVYALKEKRLANTLGRCLCLGHERRKRFQQDVLNGKDVAECVQRVLREAELPQPSPGNEVTLEDIDTALDHVAADCRFSAPELRRKVIPRRPDEVLEPLFQRLQSREAKWLTRIVLKNLSPVLLPEVIVMGQFHFLLNDLLAFQNTLESAVETLADPEIAKYSPRQPRDLVEPLKQELAHVFKPRINIYIRRQPYDKARSIKHCCNIAGKRQMTIERKYDGEYCQVHIDMTRSSPVKIFSKSGKDSTFDRVKVHDSLRQSLRLGQEGCLITTQCILEGELLVWNDQSKSIQPFRTIRKHVSRSGSFLGTEEDSAGHPDDHLMLMLYDIMLLDNIPCVRQSHQERRKLMKTLVQTTPGRIEIVKRQIIDFRSSRAPQKLRLAFAQSISQRWEGLVLKGMDDSYSVLTSSTHGIKLKKDYIAGLGDTEDFAIIGGRFHRQEEHAWLQAGIHADLNNTRMQALSWTTLYIGCLENKEDLCRWDAKPMFRVVGTVSHQCIAKEDIVLINQLGQFNQAPFTRGQSTEWFDVKIDQPQMAPMATVFKKPFVVEVMGAGFDRPAGVSYPMLRFPRVQKIHEDRTLGDTVSLGELREKAQIAESVPVDPDSQEDARWIEMLIRADGKAPYITSSSQVTTPGKSPVATPSTKKSTQSPLLRMKTPIWTLGITNGARIDSGSPCSYLVTTKRKAVGNNQDQSPTSKRIRLEAHPASLPTTSKPLSEITNISPKEVRQQRRVSGQKAASKGETERSPEVVPSKTTPVSTSIHPQQAPKQERQGSVRHDTPLTSAPSNPALRLSTLPRLDAEGSLDRTDIVCDAMQRAQVSSKSQAPALLGRSLSSLFEDSLKERRILPTFSISRSAQREAIQQLIGGVHKTRTSTLIAFQESCLKVVRKSDVRREGFEGRPTVKLHIALVDNATMDHEAVSRSSDRIMRPIKHFVKTTMNTKAPDKDVDKHALLVVDWRLLDVIGTLGLDLQDADLALKQAADHFWGAYLWPTNDPEPVVSTWTLEGVASWLAE